MVELGDNERWNDFRRRMPVVEQWAYFDHAAVAPLCEPARDAMTEWANDVANNGDVNWGHWCKQIERVRGNAAELIGAHTDEVALIRNTTEGVNLVAEGFPWKPGDNVVVPAGEFPTNLYPWKNLAARGVETRVVPTENERLDLDRLHDACDERTRIVSASWVGFATGWRNDVDALADVAHKNGALLFLDAIQGLGVFPLDVGETEVDFLAADGHKWMLGPEGAGLLYVRQRHLSTLRPLGVGWNSVVDSGDFSNAEMRLKQQADRYEGGSHNVAGTLAFGAALQLLLEFGVESIAQRLLTVTELLCERLVELGAQIESCRDHGNAARRPETGSGPNEYDRPVDRRSGIVAFTLPGVEPARIRVACRDRNVIVNCRNGRVRVSPHCYTDRNDIQRLTDAVRET